MCRYDIGAANFMMNRDNCIPKNGVIKIFLHSKKHAIVV